MRCVALPMYGWKWACKGLDTRVALVCAFSAVLKKGKNCLQVCICTVLSDYFLVHVHWIMHTVLSKSDCPPYRGCIPLLLMLYIMHAQIRSNPTKQIFFCKSQVWACKVSSLSRDRQTQLHPSIWCISCLLFSLEFTVARGDILKVQAPQQPWSHKSMYYNKVIKIPLQSEFEMNDCKALWGNHGQESKQTEIRNWLAWLSQIDNGALCRLSEQYEHQFPAWFPSSSCLIAASVANWSLTALKNEAHSWELYSWQCSV